MALYCLQHVENHKKLALMRQLKMAASCWKLNPELTLKKKNSPGWMRKNYPVTFKYQKLKTNQGKCLCSKSAFKCGDNCDLNHVFEKKIQSLETGWTTLSFKCSVQSDLSGSLQVKTLVNHSSVQLCEKRTSRHVYGVHLTTRQTLTKNQMNAFIMYQTKLTLSVIQPYSICMLFSGSQHPAKN